MRITIDTDARTLTEEHSGGETREWPLYSKEGFEILSRQWLKIGWNEKYPYCFSWMGRPIIQAPEDLVRMQEVLYSVKPDVIIETGVAHGGSLILYASLLKAMGMENARVVGVDIEIRPHNREAIGAHEMFPMITLIEGDSAAPEVVERAAESIGEGDSVLVILDSCHTKDHVAKELEAYYRLVTPGSYIVATDGSMEDLWDVPRGDPSWKEDHPSAAAREFAAAHPEFVLEQPDWPFNESELTENITHWPDSFLRKI